MTHHSTHFFFLSRNCTVSVTVSKKFCCSGRRNTPIRSLIRHRSGNSKWTGYFVSDKFNMPALDLMIYNPVSVGTDQCCGSGTFIPDPGSDFFPSRIRTVSIPDPGSSSKNWSISTPKKAKKWFFSSKKYDPGCSSRIRMLTFSHPGSRIQGSKRHPIPDPGSGSATLVQIRTMYHQNKTETLANCNKQEPYITRDVPAYKTSEDVQWGGSGG